MKNYIVIGTFLSLCIVIQGFRLYGGPGDMFAQTIPFNRKIKSADQIKFNPFLQSQQDNYIDNYMHKLVYLLADIGKKR